MYRIIKRSIIALILYLKLYGLCDAIPLIGNHKFSSSSSLSSSLFLLSPTTKMSTKSNANESSINIYIDNDNNLNLNKNVNKSLTQRETTTTTRTTEVEVDYKILNQNLKNTTTTSGQRQDWDEKDNLNAIDLTLIDEAKSDNGYYNYNVNDDSADDSDSPIPSTLINIAKSLKSMTTTAWELRQHLQRLIIRNSNRHDGNGDHVNDDDGDDMISENFLSDNADKTALDSFLIEHNMYSKHICFLDRIKRTILWWMNCDGSIRGDAIYNLTRRHSYMDFSHRNITKDEVLQRKTQRLARLSDHQNIIAYSAAYNNLSHAPYNTLLLLKDTLKYLSLRGNNFQSFKRFNKNDDGSIDPSIKNAYSDGLSLRREFSSSPENNIGRIKLNYFDPNNKAGGGIAWATFPFMNKLTELDISYCRIEFIARSAFRNLTNLRRLYMAHNNMLTIPFDAFYHTPHVQYLDLSYTNVIETGEGFSERTINVIYNLIYGVNIHRLTFTFLPRLIYLDLSHTKLTRPSAVAFTHLNEKLRYMSLCYTAFPMISGAIFKNTSLIGLDLSGNTFAAFNIIEDAFRGIAETLKFLFFERSNIKDLKWLKYLTNLHYLGLSGNNINSLPIDVFQSLQSLQVLDLSSNHIGNWYNSIFTNQNSQLRMLSLRDNNINIITSEMLRDFEMLEYLSLGQNNFVCNCMLRELIDTVALNNRAAECSYNILDSSSEILTDNADNSTDGSVTAAAITSKSISHNIFRTWKQSVIKIGNDIEIKYDIARILMERYAIPLGKSLKNIKTLGGHHHYYHHHHRHQLGVISSHLRDYAIDKISRSPMCRSDGHYKRRTSSSSNTINNNDSNAKLNSSALKFQLVDYDVANYWCFNETERLNFKQLNCKTDRYVEDLRNQLHNLTKWIIGAIMSIVALLLIGVVIYYKRWHIHYYFSYLKTASLFSEAAKEQADQLNSLAESDPNLFYDIFISYCQNDRQWVIEELLPNVENSADISICMHERDFQIGLTILDNIISCMDRSRSLMLIISSNFLRSHWCQFEMHLAQHRIFDVGKDNLILVFLEDIPRNRRPKTLQYLMDVKTYIKWPSKTPSDDERKFFWKRLRRSLENIGLHPSNESNA